MSGSRLLTLSLSLLALSCTLVSAAEDLGAHFRDPETFRQVIDTRCLNCHDRQRIEQAQRRQILLDPLQRRMVDHGAILTERDRQVLGTFWGSPMKPAPADR